MNRGILLFLFFVVSCSPLLPIKNPFEEPLADGEEIPSRRENVLLKIVVLDVGQGDATLVIGPSGRVLLVDAGPAGSGSKKILPTLDSLDIHHLSWILATHYDADHISGISEVLRGTDQIADTEDDLIPSEGILDRGDFTVKETPIYREYLQIPSRGAALAGTAPSPYRQEAMPGMRLDLGHGAVAEVVVVNGRYEDGRTVHLNPDEENEACIGLLVQYGDFRYFTAGDLTGGGSPGGYDTKDLETIAGEIIGDIDVLHVGHHGSSSSTNETFLDEIKPESAVISVGKDNDYGHPTQEVLSRLTNNNVAIYRTDLMGTLEIQTDGKEYEIAPR